MPRIAAANIAEHVQQQEAAILTAAARLFAEKGVSGTDLADIAEAVGLARSSLYRYFPDKDHILLRWFERELQPVIEQSNAIIAGPGAPEERLLLWLDFQLDYVTDPQHDLAPMLQSEIGAVSPEVQAAIGMGHARLYGTLSSLVDDALAESPSGAKRHRVRAATSTGAADRDPRIVGALLSGLLRGAAEAATHGADTETVRRELHAAARSVLAVDAEA